MSSILQQYQIAQQINNNKFLQICDNLLKNKINRIIKTWIRQLTYYIILKMLKNKYIMK